MSSSKGVNELLSQLQTQIKNYKNKLANKTQESNVSNVSNEVVSVVNACGTESVSPSNEFFIEDSYVYDKPTEPEVEYLKQIEDDQGSIKEHVMKCACNNQPDISNTSVIVDGEPTIENTSVIKENVSQKDTVVDISDPVDETKVEIKKTEKEKSFFG